MFCSNCGKELDNKWKACPDCGTEINAGGKDKENMKEKSKEIKKGIVLNSPEPLDDGGRKYNIIYLCGAISGSIIAALCGSNFMGYIFLAIVGMAVGWLIKNKILDTSALLLRNRTFAISDKISYAELIGRLVPILTPLGMTVEKSSGEDGYPIISYKGMIYDITYEDNVNEFGIYWRKNVVKAIFTLDSIDMYRKIVIAMGIIAYYIQQVSSKPLEDTGAYISNVMIQEKSSDGSSRIFFRKYKMGIMGLFVVAIIALIGTTQNNNKYISYVKNGYPEAYPDTTYGEAFEEFFGNPSWSYFQSEDGRDVVEFIGTCMYGEAEVEANIQFVIDLENETFEIEYLGFNDVPQIELIKYSLIMEVFEGVTGENVNFAEDAMESEITETMIVQPESDFIEDTLSENQTETFVPEDEWNINLDEMATLAYEFLVGHKFHLQEAEPTMYFLSWDEIVYSWGGEIESNLYTYSIYEKQNDLGLYNTIINIDGIEYNLILDEVNGAFYIESIDDGIYLGGWYELIE